MENNQNKIKISVALCTCNGEKYLSEQLHSIVNQTVKVDEIIICDDNSKDDTIKIIKYFQSKYQSLIKLYVNHKPLYTVNNFEKAVNLTTGNYIFLSDQDDIWMPNKVEVTLNFFKKNNEALLLFTNANLINKDSDMLGETLWLKYGFNVLVQNRWNNFKNQIIDLIQNKNYVTGATVCMDKRLKSYIYPVNLPKNIWHDCYFSLIAAKHKGLRFLDECLVHYRIHEDQQVGLDKKNDFTNSKMISIERYRQILQPQFKEFMVYFDSKYFPSKNKRKLLVLIKKIWCYVRY